MTVVFSDPPPSGKLDHRCKYEAVYNECRTRPGQWAEFPGPPQTLSKQNRGFEFATRGPRRARKVWVRYVGESTGSPSVNPNISDMSSSRPRGAHAEVGS